MHAESEQKLTLTIRDTLVNSTVSICQLNFLSGTNLVIMIFCSKGIHTPAGVRFRLGPAYPAFNASCSDYNREDNFRYKQRMVKSKWIIDRDIYNILYRI